MNRQELLAIVLGGIVALGMAGGVVTSAAAASASDAPADGGDGLVAAQDEDDETETETEDGQADDGQGEDRIPITEAMEVAANETEDRNGTVVGAELGQEGGLLDFGDDDESVYTVDVLLDDGTHIEVAVNATNGSVAQTEEAEEGFLEGIFGEDNVPEEPLNLSAMHNATEAVELAQNETDANGTVTQVKLDDSDDNLVYEVEISQDEGDPITVVVDAMKDGEGVIEVDGEEVDGGEETGEEGDGMGDEGGDGDEDGDEGN